MNLRRPTSGQVQTRRSERKQHSAEAGWSQAQSPNEKWGPALLPAPTAPSEGSAGVRDLIRRSFTVLDPGSPAQASLPIVIVSEDTFSIFRGPSWIDPLSRLLPPEGSAFATEGSTLPAPLASWSGLSPIFAAEAAILFDAPSPAGGDRCLGTRPPEGGWGRRPDHRLNMRSFPSRAKRNLGPHACG
jgi:hypothetical protein